MRNAGMTVAGIQSDSHYPTGRILIKPGENGRGHQFEILADQAYDFIDPAAAAAISSVEPGLVYFGTLAQRSHLSRSALETVFLAHTTGTAPAGHQSEKALVHTGCRTLFAHTGRSREDQNCTLIDI